MRVESFGAGSGVRDEGREYGLRACRCAGEGVCGGGLRECGGWDRVARGDAPRDEALL